MEKVYQALMADALTSSNGITILGPFDSDPDAGTGGVDIGKMFYASSAHPGGSGLGGLRVRLF